MSDFKLGIENCRAQVAAQQGSGTIEAVLDGTVIREAIAG